MTMDIDLLLAPIPGDNPAGEDLRYTPLYDDIKEARRADDPFALGEWQRETKSSDWGRVISLSQGALEKESKDLQVAAWLTEALAVTGGFKGLESGIRVMSGLMRDYWDFVYPEAEEGDLEFRIAPLEFLNDKLGNAIRRISLTSPDTTPGYCWLKWQESREVGYDADTKNKYGDYDERKKGRRSELIDDGKITAEEFDAAAARTPSSFFESLADGIALSQEAFRDLDATVDERFGSDAPRLSDLGKALDDCALLVSRFAPGNKNDRKGKEASPQVSPAGPLVQDSSAPQEEAAVLPVMRAVSETVQAAAGEQPFAQTLNDIVSREESLWAEALVKTENGGFRDALDNLLSVSNSQVSERGRNRYRLLVAKLCLKAGRHDLARPIMEQLSALIDELKLERWESPLWIAEVLEALYQCLTEGEPPDEDKVRAKELFTRICTMDVTKALVYRK